MSNIRECFHLIVLVVQQSAVLLAFWREITDACKAVQRAQIFHTERFEVIFLTTDEEQAHGATK